ncbi:MAG: hypothetical protein K6G10_01440 [Butyrivibrio sp.]|nr:hypothetical protein [Butyrivibrio sp.]
MYPPLEIAKNLNIADIKDRSIAKKYLTMMLDENSDLFYMLCTDKTFGTERYDGPYREFSQYIHAQWKNLYRWATGYEPERDVFNKSNRATVIDAFVGMVLCSRWNKYKAVYRFDSELELSLAAVDKVRLPVNILKNLPYRNFYLEFAPDGIFKDAFHGCFLDISWHGNNLLLKLMRLTDDLRAMSGMGDFNIDMSEDEPYLTLLREDVDGCHEQDVNGLRTDWEEFCFFVINAVMYLCASNADIKSVDPSHILSYPHKVNKGDVPLAAYECGYVYGQDVRLMKVQKSAEYNGNPGRVRKSPRPHPVKASWQHYWKGSGENKKRVLLFKDPYFVGAGADYATIRKVVK